MLKCNSPLRGRVTEDDSIPSGIIERVRQGLPIIYPTSTLPALGCRPEADALDRLFAMKRRDDAQVVSLGVADLAQATELVEVPTEAEEILAAFPAGALTLVLPAHQTMDPRLGGDAIAVRVLTHPRANALVTLTGPLTATSANLSGQQPLADCVAASRALNLPAEAALGGHCVGGVPSTLIAWNVSGYASNETNWTLIREGKVSGEEIHTWSMQRT